MPVTQPGAVLDLRAWKLTLPIEGRKNGKGTGKPREILPSELVALSADDLTGLAPYIRAVTVPAAGVEFRAPVVGFTTPGSENKRSELREMNAKDPTKLASWSSTDGVGHTCWLDVTPTRLPTGNAGVGLVPQQIHDVDDDVAVWRIEASGLWLAIGDHRENWRLIDPGYRVGTRLRLALVAVAGEIRAYRDGQLAHRFPAKVSGCYFKAGAYTQANAGAYPMSAANYGAAVIHDLRVVHGPVQAVPGPPAPAPAPGGAAPVTTPAAPSSPVVGKPVVFVATPTADGGWTLRPVPPELLKVDPATI
jgi:hypothetical protein